VVGAGYERGLPNNNGVKAENSGVIYPVYLRAEKPCVSSLDRYIPGAIAAHLEEAREAGWDAVIFPNIRDLGDRSQIAVFSPDQVRSVFE
jgi:hypothetical protein